MACPLTAATAVWLDTGALLVVLAVGFSLAARQILQARWGEAGLRKLAALAAACGLAGAAAGATIEAALAVAGGLGALGGQVVGAAVWQLLGDRPPGQRTALSALLGGMLWWGLLATIAGPETLWQQVLIILLPAGGAALFASGFLGIPVLRDVGQPRRREGGDAPLG